MPKNLNNKPRKKNETKVVEGPIIRPIKPPDNPGPNPPNRKERCPSAGRRR